MSDKHIKVLDDSRSPHPKGKKPGRKRGGIPTMNDNPTNYYCNRRCCATTNNKYEVTDISHEKYPFLHRIRAPGISAQM